MDLKGKKVLVFGAGKSGIGAADLLGSAGAQPVIYDGNADLDKEAVLHKTNGKYTPEIWAGDFPERALDSLDLVVLSPGVPTDLPLVKSFYEKGLPVWSEVELAYRTGKGEVLAITGTNGKTTTTALLGKIMGDARESVFVVGNIGTAYTSKSLEMREDSVTVAEISSFQLETIHTFHPAVSAILNITPDHLNRHHTMECYIKTKERIAENQTEDEVCVLNYEDEVLRAFGETLHTNVLYFSSRQKLDRGLYLDGEDIYYADGENTTKVINVNELNILGTHNYENVMAATGIALSLGVPMDKIVEVLKRFQAVEHRIEYVTEKRGVKFYNDSIASSPSRTIAGLRSFDQKIILIAGGYDKKIPYEPLAPEVLAHVKTLVLMGATGPRIEKAVRECDGFAGSGLTILHADSMQHAVELARGAAKPGDVVSLSPASASFDLYPNFEVRGRDYKNIVKNLK